MKISELFAGQLQREAAISRRVLERVPDGRSDWKPHEKSMALGYLSYLVASMPSWVEMEIKQDELDLNPPGGSGYRTPGAMTSGELIETHEAVVAKGLAALRETSDDHLMTSWRLLVAGRVVDESPRHQVIADTLTHLAHHRGQLTVYLRLLGATVPSIYGPSADDKVF
jgi:uncharacterized damage-inducible protein DinB